MRHLRQAGVVFAILALASSAAMAQRTRTSSAPAAKPSVWEIGMDAALSLGLDTPKLTTLDIPVSNIRAGIFASDVLEIEPFFSLGYRKLEGSSGATFYRLGAGGLYHFSAIRTKPQLYVRPFLELAGVSTSGASNSDVGIGVGVGMKWPRLNGRLAWRGEANFESINSKTSLNFLWGLSYFTR
jgi:hypothetical protein